MPAPATAEQLVDNLRKSGLVPAPKLDNLRLDCSPRELLDSLVGDQIITRYQADKIALGKYRGFVLGPYIIQDRLGGGGMGHVFLAEHSAMRRKVALKVLSLNAANDDTSRERFQREARVAAGLDHPNIVRVHDLRHEDKVLYLVMEYVDGETLQHIVARHGALPWPTAVHHAFQIALGLQHAHENRLVHRDIKPANLLLTREGTVKIIDLGLVRWDLEDSKLTEKVDQSILGTADYLAPEQAVNSSTVDIRADIYSLGATLYFLLAGRTLFPEGKTAQKLMWQQMKAPFPIGELVPELPSEVAAILHRCLAKNADERFATPADLAEALMPWCEGPPPLPEPEWFAAVAHRLSLTRSGVGPSPIADSTPPPRRIGTDSRSLIHSGRYTSSKLQPVESPPSAVPTVSDSSTQTPLHWPSDPSHGVVPTLEETSGEIRLPPDRTRWMATVLRLFMLAIALMLMGAGAFLAYQFSK
jgi:eukaryotic-like serine/threonine-protein kinase